MVAFVLTIAFTVAIYWLFRAFKEWGLSTSWAITINYFVAALFGWSLAGGPEAMNQTLDAPWLPVVVIMGLCFYPLFQLTARCTQTLGVSVASIATKLSMAIPVIVFVLFDGMGSSHPGQWAGVALAFPAVVLASASGEDTGRPWWKSLHWMPFVMFAGSGCIDLVFGWYAMDPALTQEGMRFAFASVPFTLGGMVGLLHAVWNQTPLPSWKDLMGGLALGLVNFGSLYVLLLAYDAMLMDRAMVVPVLNLSVIVVATIGGMWIFGDRLDRQARWGVAVATASIGLMMLFA